MSRFPALRLAAWIYAGHLLSWWLPIEGLFVASLYTTAVVLSTLVRPWRRRFLVPLLAVVAGLVHSPARHSGPRAPAAPQERAVCVWISGGGGRQAEGRDAHKGMVLRLGVRNTLSLPRVGELARLAGEYHPPGRIRHMRQRPQGANARIAARHRAGTLVAHTLLAPCGMEHEPPAGLRARAWLSHTLDQTQDHTGLFRALLLADRSALDPTLVERMRAAGLAHILALSGLHIGFLVMVLATLSNRLPRALAATVVVLGLLVLPLVVGTAPSVLRACAAGGAWALGRVVGRSSVAVNALGVGALLIWLADPAAPSEAGFQLSFGATGAILLVARGGGSSRSLGRVWGWVGNGLRIGGAAQIGTVGLIAHHFGVIALWAPLSGLFAIPLAAVLLAALLCGLPVAYLSGGGLGAGVEGVGGWAAWGIGAIALAVTEIPGAQLVVPYLPLGSALAITAGGLLWLRTPVPGHGLLRTLATALILVALLPPLRLALAPARLAILVADVGQGLAVWMRFPDRRTLLFDAGPPGFHGDPPVARALQGRLRAGAPDLLVVSHAHADHDGGIPWLLAKHAPRTLIYPAGAHASQTTSGSLEKLDATILPLALGEEASGPGWHVRRPNCGEQASTNDTSIALRAQALGRSLIVPGDLEREGEAALLEGSDSWDADLLILGHHGSRTSSSASFLAAVTPRVAVASAGRSNRFGHPHQETLESLSRRGIPLLRTDRDGALLFESDGERWWCYTATGRAWSGWGGTSRPRRRLR